MRQAEQFRQDGAGLAVTQVVALDAGQHEVRSFGADRCGEQPRGGQRIVGAGIFGLDVKRAVGAFGQGFADGLAGARGSETERDHFSAVLLLQLETLFQGVCVGLIDLIGEILFRNPAGGGGDLQLRVPSRNLFDRYQNLHRITAT